MSRDARALHVALIGCGHLGSYHLEKLLAREDVIVRAVVDPSAARRAHAEQLVAQQTDSLAPLVAPDLRDVLTDEHRDIDAAIVACPTPLHEQVGIACLKFGLHVLVEKPLSTTVAAAEALVRVAKEEGRVLAVGHVERFNPAIEAAMPLIAQPRFISTERLGPFSERSVEVDVIYDMMVHDLDLVRACVTAPLSEVRASGVSVLTDTVDMAAVRLAFADGTVAQLSAGRASLKPCRKLRFFTPERYVSVDCHARAVSSVRRKQPPKGERFALLVPETIDVAAGDPLAKQLEDFVAACRGERAPRNDGANGLEAVRMAHAIKVAIAEGEPSTSRKTRRNYSSGAPADC